MSIVQTTDFATGRYMIPQNQNQTTTLQEYIDTVEGSYLPRMFGKELYDLFLADLAGSPPVPVSPRFTQVFEAFVDQTNIYVESQGIKDMIKGFVYYLYIRDNVTRPTTDGLKVTTGENADNVSAISHDITSRFNDAITTYKTIQYYMKDVNPTDYPEYDGVNQSYNHTF